MWEEVVKNRMRTKIWPSRVSPTSKKLRKFMILSKLSNWHYVLQATIIYACSLWFYREHLSFKYYTCDSSLNWSTIRKCHVSKDEDAKRAVIWYTYIKCKGTLFLFLVIIISLDEMVFKLYCKLGYFYVFLDTNRIKYTDSSVKVAV